MARPLRSLGKKSVDFCGMTSPAKRDFSQLVHGDRVGEEGDVGFSAAHLVDGFVGVAKIADVCLLADFLRVEAEQLVEDDGVELAQVELALVFGQVGQGSCGSIGLGAEQEAADAGDGDEGCSRCRLRRQWNWLLGAGSGSTAKNALRRWQRLRGRIRRGRGRRDAWAGSRGHRNPC